MPSFCFIYLTNYLYVRIFIILFQLCQDFDMKYCSNKDKLILNWNTLAKALVKIANEEKIKDEHKKYKGI